MGPVLVLDPALPANITLKELPTFSAALSSTKQLLQVAKPLVPSTSVSVLLFHSHSEGTVITYFSQHSQMYKVHEVHTSCECSA